MFTIKRIVCGLAVFTFLLLFYPFVVRHLSSTSPHTNEILISQQDNPNPSESLNSAIHKDREPREFVLFTMPKTGTHLMRPLLECLTNKISAAFWTPRVECPKQYLYDKNMTNLFLLLPGAVQAYWLNYPMPNYTFTALLDKIKEDEDFLVSHVVYSTEMEKILRDRNCVAFFIIRDPRDWTISVINHPNNSGVDIYGQADQDDHFASLDVDDKIDYIIQGTQAYWSALEVFKRFLPWIKSPVCCPLRFEALIGPQGGACSEQEHLAELRKIADALQMDISDEKLLEAFNEACEDKINLVKGKAGTWKEYFNEDHKDVFKDHLGDLLITLGYEKDHDW